MRCSAPVVLSVWPVRVVPCGRCDACRATVQGQLVAQLELAVMEARKRGQAVTFATPTYDDDHVPKVVERCDRVEKGLNGCKRLVPVRHLLDSGRITDDDLTDVEREFLSREPRVLLSLRRKDQELFLKRMRISLDRDVGGCRRFYSRGVDRVRFFMCGEYGGQTGRPHYHAIFFGLPACRRWFPGREKADQSCQCEVCVWYRSVWQQGACVSEPVVSTVSRYVSGYVTKKMFRIDFDGMRGREAEFARWSRHPTLGAYVVDDAVVEIKRLDVSHRMGDFALGRGGGSDRTWLLRRSLLERGRLGMGRSKGTPDYVEVFNSLKKFGDIWQDDYAPEEGSFDEKMELRDRVLKKFEGKRRQFRAKRILRGDRDVKSKV